jgi:hypothetical protein
MVFFPPAPLRFKSGDSRLDASAHPSIHLLYHHKLICLLLVGDRWSSMARRERLSKLAVWRTTDWCPHSYQGASTSIRGQFWSMGRAFFDVRLCSEGSTEEGRPI